MALDAQRNWTASMAADLHRVKSRSTTSAAAATITQTLPWRPPPASKPAPHLPLEVVLQITSYLSSQRDLWACSLISHIWNQAASPSLYSAPYLSGPNYALFTRTICPSINISVRKSPLSSLVRSLDLSLLVHQGSKSTTARLLGRTKGSLESFVAPVASMGLNCFPALAKCKGLRHLDLALVSEIGDLKTMFDAVSGLHGLDSLHLPRSGGFDSRINSADIVWPSGLRILGLAGGLGLGFWRGQARFPAGLEELRITHCPRLEQDDLMAFLHTLGAMGLKMLDKIVVGNVPLLGDTACNLLLGYLPHLRRLSVAVDYVSPEALNPFGVAWHALPDRPVYDKDMHGPILALEELELTNSGDPGEMDKFLPLDVYMAAVDYRTVPRLKCVRAASSLTGWWAADEEDSLAELNDWLMEKKQQGTQGDVGVKKVMHGGRR